jgi:hypothetical protein
VAPPPRKPSVFPKILAALLVLGVLGAGAVAVASGALPIPGLTAAKEDPVEPAGPEPTIPPDVEPGNPQDVSVTEVRVSRQAEPNEEEAGGGISFDITNAFDGDEATAWATDGDGSGTTILITWEAPVRISEVALIPGWADGDRFVQNRTISSVTWRSRPEGTEEGQSFDASPELQSRSFDAVVISLVLRIDETQDAQAGDRDLTAISEIRIS